MSSRAMVIPKTIHHHNKVNRWNSIILSTQELEQPILSNQGGKANVI